MNIKSTPVLSKNIYHYTQKVTEGYQSIVDNISVGMSSIRSKYKMRKLKANEAHVVNELIKSILLERGGVGFESLYYDKELSALYEYYNCKGHLFQVLTYESEIVGTIAIGPSRIEGQEYQVCEIKKTYLKRAFRGTGQGQYMMQTALKAAGKLGYKSCIIEIENRNVALIDACKSFGFKETMAVKPIDNQNTFLSKSVA